MTAQIALTAIDRSIAQRCPVLSQRQSLRSSALAASDSLAPKRNAAQSAARQRPRRDAENFDGEVSSRAHPSTSLWECRVVQHSKIGRSMSAGGHNEKSPFSALRQLPPAADITAQMLTAA